jgi:membrane-associated protease RseP (regulator of RpoE activity)
MMFLWLSWLGSLSAQEVQSMAEKVIIWGTGDGVKVVEQNDRFQILRNDEPVPARLIERGPSFLQISNEDGSLAFELSLKDPNTVRWVWNPAYGNYGELIDLAGIEPGSLQRVPAELTLAPEQGGFWIEAVDPSSPAANASLQRGDQVIAIQDQRFASPVSLQRAFGADPAGHATLTLLRHGEQITVKVDKSL